MDFMRLLKSVEELLYELVTWLLFYPITLWRCIRHPIPMMAYAEKELHDDLEGQYDDALSPPIFLLITLFIAHLVELRLSANVAELPALLKDERNLLFFRAVAFSIFPLLMALQVTRVRKVKLTRKSLRPAFYGQCFTVAPFVLMIDLGLILGRTDLHAAGWPAAIIIMLGFGWYAAVQTQWLSTMGIARPRAALIVLFTMLAAVFCVLVVAGLTLLALQPLPG